MKRLIVGISGASGAIYGIRLLEVLRAMEDVETHLVMSRFARVNIEIETSHDVQYVEGLADQVHSFGNQAATISSGSFKTDGMVIAPCSIKTLSGIVHSAADSLLVRAADVVLKEQRRLVLMPREAPLHVGHCKLLYEAAQLGAVIAPPMPAFYNQPKTIDD
ncbi:MAG: UbiX family flavin prenyltransferase, partial [Planctomycetota bacterium]